MSFPISPTNNQTTVLNGITYQYNSANSSWTRVPGVITATTTLIISGTTPATSTNTGALQVYGGVGIGGALWVGTTSYIAGAQILTTATFQAFNTGSVSLIIAGTDTSINSSTGVVTIWNTSTLQTITSRGSSTTYAVSITNTNASTSTTTGALTVSGGIGVGGSVYVGGNTLQVGSGPTGLIIQPMVGGSYGAIYSTNIVPSTTNYTFITDGASPNFNGTNGVFFNVNNVNKLQVYPTYLNITPTTASTSTTTGALQVAGGVGVGGGLFVGGVVTATSLVVTSTASSTSTTTGALTVAGGVGIGGGIYAGGDMYLYGNVASPKYLTLSPNTVSGDISSQNVYVRLGNPSSGNPPATAGIQFSNWYGAYSGLSYIQNNNGGAQNGLELYAGAGSLWFGTGGSGAGGAGYIDYSTGNWRVSKTTASTSTNTGALTVAGGVGVGGAVYIGTNSYIANALILTTATVNQYANQTTITAGTDTAVSTSTGNVTIWNTSNLQTITNRGNSTTNVVIINNNTTATSTTTGALVVVGGVGIGGSVYVGNRVGWGSSTGTSVAYQFYNQATGSMDMVFG